jgi:anaerobic carbon-monoxide dehydrogenase iron sulfur subunit
MTMKQLVIKPRLCINCHACEKACAYSHTGQYDLPHSRVRVIDHPDDHLTVPAICLQCIDAACMNSCPTGAIVLQEDIGAVLVDYNLCIGCKSCVAGCPFGHMFEEPEHNGFVFKCDLCFGNPVCAIVCPTGALTYAEIAPLTGKQQMVLEV